MFVSAFSPFLLHDNYTLIKKKVFTYEPHNENRNLELNAGVTTWAEKHAYKIENSSKSLLINNFLSDFGEYNLFNSLVSFLMLRKELSSENY